MTLPEAITKLRAHYQHVLELEAKATKGPWRSDGKVRNDPREDEDDSRSYIAVLKTLIPQPPEAMVVCEVNIHCGSEVANAQLITESRNSIAPTARLVLALLDDNYWTLDCGYMCPSNGGHECQCKAKAMRALVIACAEELEGK